MYYIVVLSQCGVHRVPSIHEEASQARRRPGRRSAESDTGRACTEAGSWRVGSRLGWCAQGAHGESDPRKGKRRGYRYLYLYLEKREHLHLFLLLDKNEQEDASEEQRKLMREWAAQIKRQARG
jgi:hypothetical protein